MMFTKHFTRFFHSGKQYFAAEKSLLATLRKKTGYTFTNCKKALELNNNDLGKAEKWLQDQAQAMGWTKATKLEGRHTSQGLVGVTIAQKCGVLVELNCETDFVARNVEFQKMVEHAANSCVRYTMKQQSPKQPLTKYWFSSEQLKNIPADDGKPLADHLALMIGIVGENASLKRALCFKVDDGVHLSGYAHPSGSQSSSVLLGRFGGIVALKQTTPKEPSLEEIGKGLCQHIVGMDPKKVGSSSDDPAANKDDETCLIHQEYLLDEGVLIKDLLEENNVEVLDFKRFQCGENEMAAGDQHQPQKIASCQ